MAAKSPLMADNPTLPLHPSLTDLPQKGDSSPNTLLVVGAGPPVKLCSGCRKEPAEVGGLCISCDHLQGDIQIDQNNQGR